MNCCICQIKKKPVQLLKHLKKEHSNDLKYHLEVSKQIKKIESSIDPGNKCEMCGAMFSYKHGLKKHQQNSCKGNDFVLIKNKITGNPELFDQVKQFMESLSGSNNTEINKTSINIEGDNNKVNVNVDNHIDNKIINNITNTNMEPLKDNIDLYNTFRETLGEMIGGTYHLSQKYHMHKRNDAIIKLIEFISFNEDYPENHNFYVPNRKLQDYVIFCGNQWKRTADTSDINDLIKKIKNGMLDLVAQMIDENKISESEINFKKLKEGLDEKSTEEFFQKVFMKAYEHKDMVKETRAKQELENAVIRK